MEMEAMHLQFMPTAGHAGHGALAQTADGDPVDTAADSCCDSADMTRTDCVTMFDCQFCSTSSHTLAVLYFDIAMDLPQFSSTANWQLPFKLHKFSPPDRWRPPINS